ncbi:hypothetical protein EYC80_005978 [Monilinia laxa]|uniref:Uncharacterized protein n=1 Tax=Monilinia laxa TaxID=61186 RepID=A0A5N6KFQ5_MONLA|nr:hypothetical protein EYC80_005978 [Monilinia laxa]
MRICVLNCVDPRTNSLLFPICLLYLAGCCRKSATRWGVRLRMKLGSFGKVSLSGLGCRYPMHKSRQRVYKNFGDRMVGRIGTV